MNSILLTVLAILIPQSHEEHPNTCSNFVDYITMDPNNCWYNPDVNLDARQMIKRHNYPFEEYEVETEDHYILSLMRMPKRNRRGIAFLQHPALTTCVGWIDKGPHDSLGYILWDAGYDVWLGNFRGTSYSRRHKFYTPEQASFWNFSFHEMGYHDISAQINMVVNITNAKPQEIVLIGYSMGSTAAVVYASMLPEECSKLVKFMALMAPSTHLRNIDNITKAISVSADGLMDMAQDLKFLEVAAHNSFFKWLAALCRGPLILLCVTLDLTFFGNVPSELPAKWFSIKYGQNPGGVSTKTLIHYAQMTREKGRFQMYDYGPEKNLEYYHTERVPAYPVENITTPVLLMYGDNDPEAHYKDVEHFYTLLPKQARLGKFKVNSFNHAAFWYGTHVREKVYLPLVKLMNSYFPLK